jgi:hypothetical protein
VKQLRDEFARSVRWPARPWRRITVALVVNLIASGISAEEILSEYPSVQPDDITQALHYAAWLAEETVLPGEAMPA